MKDTNKKYRWRLQKNRVYVELTTTNRHKTRAILDLIKDGFTINHTKPITK